MGRGLRVSAELGHILARSPIAQPVWAEGAASNLALQLDKSNRIESIRMRAICAPNENLYHSSHELSD